LRIVPFRTEKDVADLVDGIRKHLEGGGLLAYPTETVYGLGSRAVSDDVASLSRLKGRPPNKPFLLLVSGRVMAENCGLVFSPAAGAMSEEFWPGPLTLVLRGGEGFLPDALRGAEGGIAVRWSSNRNTSQLITKLGFPITSTSANRPGGPTAPGVDAIRGYFGEDLEKGALIVLDGGVLGNVPPSTIVDCTTDQPLMIREGAIPRNELQRRVGGYAP
jgi:L-threonylcarbamoyladenylate synthase